MGLLSSIVAGAGSLLGGDAIKDIGNIVDDLHTSGEEKEEAKQKITQILAQAEQAAQAQVSARWEADLKHGSWLSKNIRQITLIFLTAVFVILSVFDGNNIQKAMIYDTKAEIYWKMKLYNEAIITINKSIEIDPDNKYYINQKNKFLESIN